MKEALQMEDKIEGIFCKERMARIGTGYTSRKTLQKTYWYVEGTEEVFSCWLLSINGEKVGTPEIYNPEQFVSDFLPEFSYPQVKEITSQDIENFRMIFKIQIKYKEEENAKRLLLLLIELQERLPMDLSLFLLEIGSMFRKGTLYTLALFCYTQAQHLGVDSATLYFNIARTYFDLEDYKQCIHYLKEAHIRFNGSSTSIKKLIDYLQKNSLVPQEARDDINYILFSKKYP